MANRYWVSGGTGNWNSTTNWSTTSGGVSGATVPGASDAALFDATSGSGTATLNISPDIQRLTLTGFTGTLAFGSNKITVNSTGGVFTGSASCTITGTPVIDANNSSATARTITAATVSEANAISINVTAGSGNVTLTGNVLNLNFTGFSGSLAGGARTIYGDLTIAAGMSTAATTSNTTFAATSGTKTITTNNVTLDLAVTFNAPGASYNFADALTLNSTRVFTFIDGTVRLKNGTTSVVGSFVTTGTNQKYLESTLAGSQATLSDASGTNSLSYTSIKDSNATGGAAWNAFVTNNIVNAGNNTGWNFGIPFDYAIEFSPALRSFTERKHF